MRAPDLEYRHMATFKQIGTHVLVEYSAPSPYMQGQNVIMKRAIVFQE